MSIQYPGGFITKSPPAVVGPVDGEGGSAPGVWTLDQAMGYEKQGLWPKPVLPKQLWTWGRGLYGELGIGNTTDYSSPKQVASLTTWSKISSNTQGLSNLAIKTDGTLWSWGYGGYGALGLGNITDYSSPMQIGSLTGWSKIFGGSNCFYAIKTNGTLWSWGLNGGGELGLGNTTSYSSPKQVGALTNWYQVAGGSSFAIAIKTDGTLWSWGFNFYGSLGLGNTTDRLSPVQVGSLTNWSSVSAIGYHCASIKTDGTLWVWGRNNFGQLGLGNTINYSSPKQVGTFTYWKIVSNGGNFTLSIKTDGTLWSWGGNTTYGQLGLGNTTNYSSPKQVGALTNWLKISSGYYSCTSIKTDSTLWVWGNNNFGQLGIGSTTNRSSPVQVGALTTWVVLPDVQGFYMSAVLKTP
jgi:alpha-tubulin suppressor-like RCC1 family protein